MAKIKRIKKYRIPLIFQDLGIPDFYSGERETTTRGVQLAIVNEESFRKLSEEEIGKVKEELTEE